MSVAAARRQATKQITGTADGTGLAWRIATALGLLALAVAAALTFLIGLGVLDASPFGLGGIDGYLAADDYRRLGVTAGAAGVGVVALALLVRRPGRRESTIAGKHVVAMTDRGIVVVTSQSVSTLVCVAVRQQAGVLAAEVRVRGDGASPIRLLVRASVMPGSALPAVGAAIQEAARDSVERLVGLAVLDINVEMQVAVAADLARVLE